MTDPTPAEMTAWLTPWGNDETCAHHACDLATYLSDGVDGYCLAHTPDELWRAHREGEQIDADRDRDLGREWMAESGGHADAGRACSCPACVPGNPPPAPRPPADPWKDIA